MSGVGFGLLKYCIYTMYYSVKPEGGWLASFCGAQFPSGVV